MRNFMTMLLLFFSIVQTSAQCSLIEQPSKNTTSPTTEVNTSTLVGQSFKSCRNGQLSKITINATLPTGAIEANTTLSVAVGATTSSGIVHTQPVTITANGDIEISLSQSVKIENNQIYTFFFGGAGDAFEIAISNALGGSVYPDGTLIQNGTALGSADLFFSLSLTATPATPATPQIPTMSDWGLVVFMLLILNCSIFYIQLKESLLVG